MNFKEELAAKAENTAAAKKNDGIKLTTNMSIVDMTIRRRQREGIDVAKKRGKKFGRHRKWVEKAFGMEYQ